MRFQIMVRCMISIPMEINNQSYASLIASGLENMTQHTVISNNENNVDVHNKSQVHGEAAEAGVALGTSSLPHSGYPESCMTFLCWKIVIPL